MNRLVETVLVQPEHGMESDHMWANGPFNGTALCLPMKT